MSLASKAVLGAMWTVAASIGGRLASLVGTLLLTRFIAPDLYGEVNVASILALSAHALSHSGFPNYIVAKPDAGRDVAFHCTIFHVGIGMLALAVLVLFGDAFAPLVDDGGGMTQYLPGLALAVLIERVGFVPARVVARQMRFHVLALRQLVGELSYAAVSVYLAYCGWGGDAIVWGNLARGLLLTLVVVAAIDWRDWLQPSPIRMDTLRELFRFGWPITLGSALGFASAKWDNLIVSYLFGTATVGRYNLAYNLADLPATQVGENIGDVLLPSFAKIETTADRLKALTRATGLLSLVVFPLALGLGAVAPSLVRAVFDPRWEEMAPYLVVLSSLSVTRPMGWMIRSYLEAARRTRAMFILEGVKAASVIVCIFALGQLGPLFACAGVGVAFGVYALASNWVIHRADGLPFFATSRQMALPLLACGPMVAAILGVRQVVAMAGAGNWLSLALELLVGIAVYIFSALVIARRQSRDFLSLVRNAIRRRRAH